ncbi:MAG: HAMP domain-containing protein [Elusimicrobia bacterium]|nr:HAMP domain-containing protein [Elusimicrobiota bacterium]MBD3411879.1 HAMP domain-containing protein [Elusimicrobiota bacterium]
MNIKLKYLLVGMIILLMAFGIGLVSTIFIVFERKELALKLQQDQLDIKEHIVQIAQDALIGQDDILLINYIRLIKRTHPEVRFAFLLSNDGFVLSDIPEKELRNLLNADPRIIIEGLLILKKHRFMIMKEPIIVNQKKSGMLFIGFDYRAFVNELARRSNVLSGRIIFGALFALGIGILVTFLVTAWILRPIQTLTAGVRQIAHGVLSHRIRVNVKNELGELAAEFNRMSEQLQELDIMKNNFISSVSHELRTPLSAIRVYVELLKENPAMYMNDEKRAKALSIMHHNIDRLYNFISDILDLACIKAGKLDLSIVKIRITDIIKETITFYRPLFEKNNVRLLLLNDTPPPPVYIDPPKIRQVITNLIGNALKFTPENGEVNISYHVTDDFLQVSVSDTGIGIPADQVESVFEQFKKVKNDQGPGGGKTKGTGLGLSICKGIIQAHGGRIWAESIVNRGSTFHFTLPFQLPPSLRASS